MKLSDLITELRVLLDDEAQPYLWSDPQLTSYLNEAENEACIRARLIYDEDSDLTRLQAAANDPVLPLNALMLAVDRVYAADRALTRTTSDELDNLHGGRWKTTTGQPRRFFEEETYLRLFPTPTADTDVQIACWRLPLDPLTDQDDEPEIHVRFHMQMLDWAAHLAFKRRDADAQDLQRAATHEARFSGSFGIRPDANVARKRRLKNVPICRPIW